MSIYKSGAEEQEYRAGTLSTSQMKEACIEKIQGIVAEFQAVSAISRAMVAGNSYQKRAAVTPEILASFQDKERKIDPRPTPRKVDA
jgi:tryptophanyl-tRNA synthetase